MVYNKLIIPYSWKVTNISQTIKVTVTRTETSHVFNKATHPDKSHCHKITSIY